MSNQVLSSQDDLWCCGKLFYADRIKGRLRLECSQCGSVWTLGPGRIFKKRKQQRMDQQIPAAGPFPLSLRMIPSQSAGKNIMTRSA